MTDYEPEFDKFDTEAHRQEGEDHAVMVGEEEWNRHQSEARRRAISQEAHERLSELMDDDLFLPDRLYLIQIENNGEVRAFRMEPPPVDDDEEPF